MTPRKHRDLIVAWANGAEIQILHRGKWIDDAIPSFWNDTEYRVKPAPKPDVVRYLVQQGNTDTWESYKSQQFTTFGGTAIYPCVKVTFDGETGTLKSAEVIK